MVAPAMTLQGHRNMALWALRDLMRRPGEALLSAGVLALLTLTIGAPLLISHCLTRSMDALLAAAPAMVVRKTDPTGWRPMPLGAAAAVSKIPGAIDVQTRIWGRAASASGPVTVVAWMPMATAPPSWPPGPPVRGDLVAGPGVFAPDNRLTLYHGDGTPAVFAVTGRLAAAAALQASDLVLVHPDDARALLGIPEGYATDLTVDVFHETEIPAISAELIARLPFPVQIDDRASAAGRYHASVAAGNGARIARFFPALVALFLLVLAGTRQHRANTGETGLLRAMGWSAADLHRRHLYAALWVGLPAVVLGCAAAYSLLALPDLSVVAAFLWGRPLPPGMPAAVTADLGLVLVAVSALVLIPYVVSVALAALIAVSRSATIRPQGIGGRP